MWWDAYWALASEPQQVGLSPDEWARWINVHTS